MAEKTEISWTDATFNPWMGCTKVGPGCDHCYAENLMDTRHHKVMWGPGNPRVRTGEKNWNLPKRWNASPFYECACGYRGEKTKPWRDIGICCPNCEGKLYTARRRVFCSSLADVFDNEVDPAWRADLLNLIAATPNLDWLLLTKRIGNVTRMLADLGAKLPSNVWLGATIVNREEMLRDGPKLKAVPARVRFWSGEPLLGDIGPIPVELLPDWVISGFESGANARPGNPAWVRNLRDTCVKLGAAFHHKQNGEWVTVDGVGGGQAHHYFDDGTIVRKVGKKAAGRLLDGVEHNAFPEVCNG